MGRISAGWGQQPLQLLHGRRGQYNAYFDVHVSFVKKSNCETPGRCFPQEKMNGQQRQTNLI